MTADSAQPIFMPGMFLVVGDHPSLETIKTLRAQLQLREKEKAVDDGF